MKGGNMQHHRISLILIFSFLFFSFFLHSAADEGMYLLDEIDKGVMEKMKKLGLELPLEEIYNSEGTGLASAVVNMGATASFVSPKGLMVTNHHVAFGAVQRISTPDENYIKKGFLARSLEEEVPAPGYQAYVPISAEDVTKEVLSAVKKDMTDFERYQAIEKKIKEIISKAEKGGGVEAEVEAMNFGMKYYLFTSLRLKDIRIVYVPAISIGEYGGDVDNWMWPRHTGDFAFMRAYVGPDGKPADYSQENMPYQPKSYLKISTKGIKKNDFAMILGYPGRTYRHLTSFAIHGDQEFRYPFQIQLASDLIHIFKDVSKKDEKAAVKLSYRIKGLNNVLKNNQGMFEGLIKTHLLDKKRAEEKAFGEFLKNNSELEKKYGSLLLKIETLYQQRKKIRKKSTLIGRIRWGSSLLNYALMINKWSIERQKKDIEREPGYQDRDLPELESRFKVAQRSLVPEADKKALRYILKKALALPSNQKIQAVERIIDQNPGVSKEQAINAFLDEIYKETNMLSAEGRVKMFHLSRKELIQLNDPFIQFADELEKERDFLRRKEKEFSGALSRLMPVYLEGVKIWKKSTFYPDANGTLRLNFGQVKGYAPRDAVWYDYLTSLGGVVEKHTGEDPFDAPEKLLALYKDKDFGAYVDKHINDVPVNFLTTNDSTGGNSGSPVLNEKGELIGLLFDGNYEALYSDYYFDLEMTRTISVDIRYVLFIAEKLDKALNVLKELTLVQ